MVGKQLVGKPAEFAGDEAMQREERVFGWVQAETETGEYTERNDAFEEQLAEEYDGEIATRFTYLFDPAQGADIATTAIARMKEAGVTTIILSTDPLHPGQHHRGGDGAELLPGVGHRAERARRHDHLRPHLRPGAVVARPRARAHRRPGRSGSSPTRTSSYEWYYGEPPAGEHPGRARARPGPLRPAASTSPVRTSRPETFEQGHVPLARATTRGSPTRGTRGATACGRRPTATPPTTPPPSGGTPTPPARTRPATRAPARSCYVDGGHRYLPGDWPTEPIPWFDDEGRGRHLHGAARRAARVPGLARVAGGRIAHLGPPPASLSAAGGG